ncbi:MAG: quinoprotein dehydrogenase-associated SoxYZ-like carrier [Methylococcaceae bacterium]
MNKQLIRIFLFLLMITPALTSALEKDETNWNNVLKNQYYSGKSIQESDDVITIEAPYRAEDPALVPLKITSHIKQTKEKYIKKITVFVDKNPFPFVGEFEFIPESGKADLAIRVRVNTYSYIRAIAELNNGQFYMSKKFVKASGGCSAPIGDDLDAAMKRLGKMKFRLDKKMNEGEATLAQLLISHPNITGMQMDQVSRFIKKSHFVDHFKVTFDNKPVLTAKIDIAISSDPNFRFYFVPTKSGKLKAEFTDTSCEKPTSRDVCTKGKSYSVSYNVNP